MWSWDLKGERWEKRSGDLLRLLEVTKCCSRSGRTKKIILNERALWEEVRENKKRSNHILFRLSGFNNFKRLITVISEPCQWGKHSKISNVQRTKATFLCQDTVTWILICTLLFCLQLEKYQDIIKATEEFETKLVSFGVF